MSLLTQDLIARSRVIAEGRRIRDWQRLLQTYGGTKTGWKKKSSQVFRYRGQSVEIHWYEHHGVGTVEEKIKIIR